MSESLIEVSGATVEFAGRAILRDVSFAVGRGEMCAFIGPNGAGKTTLLNTIAGQVTASAGKLMIRGIPVRRPTAERLYDLGVARTFQIATAFSSLTVGESVAVALARKQKWRLWSRPTLAGVDEALAKVGLREHRDRAVAALSYADVKRVDLAVALAVKPDVLLLDEPASGVGPVERDQLLRAVQEHARSSGAATIFAEHDVNLVFRYASRVIVLHQGSVIKDAEPEAVRTDPIVAKIYLGEWSDG